MGKAVRIVVWFTDQDANCGSKETIHTFEYYQKLGLDDFVFLPINNIEYYGTHSEKRKFVVTLIVQLNCCSALNCSALYCCLIVPSYIKLQHEVPLPTQSGRLDNRIIIICIRNLLLLANRHQLPRGSSNPTCMQSWFPEHWSTV